MFSGGGTTSAGAANHAGDSRSAKAAGRARRARPTGTTQPGTASTRTATTNTAAGSSTTGAAPVDILAQINLLSADAAYPAAVGVAQLVRAGGRTGIVIAAQGVPANPAQEYYAVWLQRTATDSERLGFLPERVGRSGKLVADAVLPADAARYTTLLITLDTAADRHPGTVVLAGAFRFVR